MGGFGQLLSRLQIPALEEDTSGIADEENELVVYGRLTNPQVLENATRTIGQDQATFKHPQGSVRVRKATENGSVEYILTAKKFIKNGGRNEVSTTTSEGLFKVFCDIVGEHMDKTRYTFPTGIKQTHKGEERELMWEVDVFHDGSGKDQEWIKIDLEYYQPLDTLPGLPVILEDMIFSMTGQYTPEEKAKIRELYDTVFTVKL